MTLAISVIYNQQRSIAADKKGLSDDQIGWFQFPVVPGGKRAPTDTLGGVVGWVVSKGAPKETLDFIKAFVSPEVQSRLYRRGLHHPGRRRRGRVTQERLHAQHSAGARAFDLPPELL